jgi:hypothetical protein
MSIGRAERPVKDAPAFVVASEDTYAPKQYFKALGLARVTVVVIPTPENSGLSSPGHVVERLKEAFRKFRNQDEIQGADEFWVMLDTDHHMKDNHISGTLRALRGARQVGFELAISNPCFELWLLLHHVDLPADTVFDKSADVATRLGEVLGGYNKTAVKAGRFPLSLVPAAILRARALESNPDNPEGYWPTGTGTRVYRLMERVMGGRSS